MPSGKALSKALLIIDELRQVDIKMPVQMAYVFLSIAREPGLSLSDLMQRTGLSLASVSHIVANLGRRHELGTPGYDLVITEEDPFQPRSKLVRLTEKGEAVAKRIASLV